MKNFTTFITEANAVRDTKIRQEAIRVWNKVIRTLKEDPAKFMTFYPDAVVIALAQVIQEKEYYKLAIVVKPKDKLKAGSIFAGSETSFVHINVLPNDFQFGSLFGGSFSQNDKEKQSKSVLKLLGTSNQKETFIHEFVHFLDHNRMGQERWDRIIKNYKTYNDNKEDAAAYYNQPIELNAHTQELLSIVDQNIKELKQELEKEYRKSDKLGYATGTWWETNIKTFKEKYANPNKFIARVKTDATFLPKQSFLKGLTPENLRKVAVRLWQHWESQIAPMIKEMEARAKEQKEKERSMISKANILSAIKSGLTKWVKNAEQSAGTILKEVETYGKYTKTELQQFATSLFRDSFEEFWKWEAGGILGYGLLKEIENPASINHHVHYNATRAGIKAFYENSRSTKEKFMAQMLAVSKKS